MSDYHIKNKPRDPFASLLRRLPPEQRRILASYFGSDLQAAEADASDLHLQHPTFNRFIEPHDITDRFREPRPLARAEILPKTLKREIEFPTKNLNITTTYKKPLREFGDRADRMPTAVAAPRISLNSLRFFGDLISSELQRAQQIALSLIREPHYVQAEARALVTSYGKGLDFHLLGYLGPKTLRAAAEQRFDAITARNLAEALSSWAYNRGSHSLRLTEPRMVPLERHAAVAERINRVDICEAQLYGTFASSRLREAYVAAVLPVAERLLRQR